MRCKDFFSQQDLHFCVFRVANDKFHSAPLFDYSFLLPIFATHIYHLSTLVSFMEAVAPFSYDHPRRVRPFATSSEKARRPLGQNGADFPDVNYRELQQSLSRIESNLNEKISTLFNRIEKCSDLSVASSRAVAAISAQFEGFKLESTSQIEALSKATEDIRSSTSRLCSESQNLTMTALEDCCGKLMDQVKSTGDQLSQVRASQEKLDTEMRLVCVDIQTELKDVRMDIEGIAKQVLERPPVFDDPDIHADMRLIAEESVNSGLDELNRRFNKEMDAIDTEWKEYRTSIEGSLQGMDKKITLISQTSGKRYDELRQLFDERTSKSTDDLEEQLEKLKREIATLAVKRESDHDATLSALSLDIHQVQSTMDTFATITVPALFKEVDTKIAHTEYRSQETLLDLMKEHAVEIDSEIDRMVELIHSVYVHTGVAMPPGTMSSWKRFRHLVFDQENVGGVRVRRPILGEAKQYLTPRGMASHRAAKR